MANLKSKKKTNSSKKETKERKTNPLFWIIGLLILVFAAHLPSLFNGFTNWDDPAYITQNEFIKAFSLENLKTIFGEFHSGHYHPFTWLSLAFDYSLFELKPFGFHLFNIVFHLINVYFVFVFIKLLSDNGKAALLTALLFGISPLSVESVSWITERKNLLYTLFFFATLIAYIKYTNRNKVSLYIFSVLLFIASLLSKSMAITLPVVLVLIDYFKGRSLLSKKVWIEKIPFFAISVVFGIAAIKAQSIVASIASDAIPFDVKIMYGSWGFMNYFIRLLAPFKLSPFYPFNLDYPGYYSLGILFCIAFLFLIFRSYRRNDKISVFGLVFFLLNLVLLLKFFSTIANSVYMADRYTYVSSVGLFFVLSTILLKQRKAAATMLIVILTCYYGIYTFNQSKVWKDSISLWNNVIKQYPEAHVALLNRGNAYRNEKQYPQAMADYNLILKTDSAFFEALVNRGYVYDMLGNYKLALNDYEKALVLRPNDKNTLYNKSLCLQNMGENEEAAYMAQNEINAGNESASAYNILGNASFAKNNFPEAIEYYSKAIELDGEVSLYWYNRANSKAMLKKHAEAMPDYNKAIELEKTNADYYFNRGTTLFFVKDYKGAKNDMESAIKINSKNATYFLNKSNVEIALGNNETAILDLTSAINLDVNNAQNYARRAMIYFQINKTELGCKDANTSVRLGFTQANELLQKYCK